MLPKKKEMLEWSFSLVGYFNHYSFFTKKLWRNIKEFKHVDEAEIKCMFMHYWLHHKFGIFTIPCGVSWCAEVDEYSYNEYIANYQQVIDLFEKWIIEQR